MFLWAVFRRFLALVVLVLMHYRRALLLAIVLFISGSAALGGLGRISGASNFVALPNASASAASRTVSSGALATRGALGADAPASVESYIKGLIEFDARLMWSSLSEEAINQMQSRGGSLEALQQGLDEAKRRGARYEDVTFIGNYPLRDGGRYLFYVLSRRGFAGPDQLDQVYFVFTVTRDGKIARIE